ncbi:endomucin isoform X3 [Equus asinus]|uniref:endomucin isoform X3 n=1 Tax=Equus asinus TaxID=9793 RepID=UPI0038F66703
MGTMKLLPVTILCLLSTLRRSDGNPVDGTATTPALSQSTVAATRTSVPTPTTTPSPSPTLKSTVTSPKEATTSVTKGEFITTNTTVTSLPVSDAVSTLQSSHNKTENQNSTKTTERTETGTENAKNASSSSTNPSYSSIILPVVITLIVVTLSVFVLVGLYRMCWKTDPGAPENGNNQPQSDKESVKLLTVKTISHESGEHCAQGKTKN